MIPEEHLARYLRHLKDERRLSPHTLSAYERDIRSLLAFLGRGSLDLESLDSSVGFVVPEGWDTYYVVITDYNGADGGSDYFYLLNCSFREIDDEERLP